MLLKHRHWIITLLLTVAFNIFCSGQQRQPRYLTSPSYSPIEQELRSIEGQELPNIAGEIILSINPVQEFYRQRTFNTAWLQNNRLSANARKLISEIQSADLEGLNPLDYHLQFITTIQSRRKSKRSQQMLAQLDILLTDAYLSYANHLYYGKVCPEDVNQDWYVPCREPEIEFWNYLASALAERTVSESLARLKPSHPGYQQLKMALVRYRNLLDENHDTLAILNQDSSVNMRAVQQKLIQVGDLGPRDDQPHQLSEAIIKFKQRHGLPADSNIDSETVSRLSVPLEASIRTIVANLERWRWLPEKLGSRHILVNIADFSLKILEDEEVIFSRPVIIGTTYHATPAMAAELSQIVLNPYWYLPGSVVREILLKKDPVSYMRSNHIQVLDHKGQIIPFDKIDWEHQKPAAFAYILRQTPGPHNALGDIKFLMPNPYAIYIHDTPDKELFDQNNRTFSRGCIRVKDPFELAAVLLQENPDWNEQSLKKVAGENSLPTEIDLSVKIPVYVLYWTSWVSNNQSLQFRADVYNRDQALIEALAFSPEN